MKPVTVIFVMLMATPATSATPASDLTTLFSVKQTMTMDLGLLLKQTINLNVDKVVVDENNNIYNATASMTQIQSFSELTGMEIPFSSDLKTGLVFMFQETITPSGRSYDGRIALDSSLNLWDYLAIPFTGELTENSFTLQAKGKSLEVNWKKEDEGQWYNEIVIEFKDPSSGEEVGIRANLIPDTSEVKIVLLNNQDEQGTMTVSQTGEVTIAFRPNQKIYDIIDKYFLFFGRMWFGEECTLEKAKEAVMLMFGWSSGSSGSGSACSIYPEGHAWFKFKLPAFFVS